MTEGIKFKDNWELVLFGFLFSMLISIPVYEVVFVTAQIDDIEERVLSCTNYEQSKDSLRECIQDEFPN